MDQSKISSAMFDGIFGGLLIWGGLYLTGMPDAGSLAWGYCVGVTLTKGWA